MSDAQSITQYPPTAAVPEALMPEAKLEVPPGGKVTRNCGNEPGGLSRNPTVFNVYGSADVSQQTSPTVVASLMASGNSPTPPPILENLRSACGIGEVCAARKAVGRQNSTRAASL